MLNSLLLLLHLKKDDVRKKIFKETDDGMERND